MRSIAIIPARYASTRFPAKPLVKLGDKYIIQHVYERVAECVEMTYVATDDERIYDRIVSFGGEAVMTSPNHKSGTDRCAEAYKRSGYEADIVINVQGDEPFIATEQIEVSRALCTAETALVANFANAQVSKAVILVPIPLNILLILAEKLKLCTLGSFGLTLESLYIDAMPLDSIAVLSLLTV